LNCLLLLETLVFCQGHLFDTCEDNFEVSCPHFVVNLGNAGFKFVGKRLNTHILIHKDLAADAHDFIRSSLGQNKHIVVLFFLWT